MPDPKDSARPSGYGLDSEQWKNAAIIYQVGKRLGMSRRDITIGLITAMQESGLRNVNYGDRDSLGLFQQRPSQGWGTPEQVTDPSYAARKFFTTLKGVDGREGMRLTEAAQAVQRSAYPDAYAKHVPLIRDIFPIVQQRAGDYVEDMDGKPYGGAQRELIGGETFIPGLDPDREAVVDRSGMAEYLLSAPSNPLLGAPALDPSGSMVDPELELFTSPLRSMAPDEFSTAVGADYGTKGANGMRRAVLEIGRELIGTPYVWGGDNPNVGFDCSGLVQYVYGKLGINLPRVSYQQANAGQRIGLSQLQPGDLVAWDNSTRNNGADHIAIYIGNGQILEAPRRGLSVRIRELDDDEGAWGVRLDL